MIARLKSNLLCPHVNRNTFRTSSSRFGEWFGAHGASSFSFCGRLEELLEEWNTSGDETLVVPSEYLEVVAVRR